MRSSPPRRALRHLRITKGENGVIAFSHRDGSAYGTVTTRPPADVYTKVLAALSGLGFRKTDARRAVSELSQASDAGSASCERLLREALQRLTRPRA
jgi:Holliday junction resolvasome RuvABC DNA-binding subunit